MKIGKIARIETQILEMPYTKPLVTAEHALHVLEIMLQALASGRDGQAKPVHSRFAPPEFAAERPDEPAHLRHDRTRKEFT